MLTTRNQRQNAAQVGVPLPVSVLPSGVIGSTARSQVGWSYFEGGIVNSQYLMVLGCGS